MFLFLKKMVLFLKKMFLFLKKNHSRGVDVKTFKVIASKIKKKKKIFLLKFSNSHF